MNAAKSLKAIRGFSLLEIVIVIALLGLFAGLGSSFYGNFTRSVDLDSAAANIVSDLKAAQAQAISGADSTGDGISDKWGICFRNPTGDDLYEIVSPPSTCTQTSSSTVKSTVYLQNGIIFDILGGDNFELVSFDKISGTTAADVSIYIYSSGEYRKITIASSGLISDSIPTSLPVFAPIVASAAANPIGAMTVTFNGTVNPNNDETDAWFRYWTSDPVTCSDSGGTPTGISSIAAGAASVGYSQVVTGLTESTPYWYCAIASNSAGTTIGTTVQSFTTNPVIGSIWTVPSSPTSSTINAIAYSPALNRFVIGMDNGETGYSNNSGVTWASGNTVQAPDGSTPRILNLLWSTSFNKFIATGSYGAIAFPGVWTSSDGISWSEFITTGISQSIAETTNLIVGSNGTGTTGRSTNGTAWSTGSTGDTDHQRGMAYCPSCFTGGTGTFVSVGEAGTIYTSPDGITWTARTSGTGTNLASVAYSPTLGKFLATATNGASRTSTDGITWTGGTSSGVSMGLGDKVRWIGSMFLSTTATAGRLYRRDTPTSTAIAVNTGDAANTTDVATDGAVIVVVHGSGHIRTAPLSQ